MLLRYFSTVLFHYLLFDYLLLTLYYLLLYCSTTTPSCLHLGNPTLHVEPGFFSILLFNYLLLYYLLLYYSTTTPAACISETKRCMLSQDFTILLFQNCTIPLFTILLFILCYLLVYDCTTTPAVCISEAHLCMLPRRASHKVCISKTHLCMLNPKFAC